MMINNCTLKCYEHTNPVIENIFLTSLISLKNGFVLGTNIWISIFNRIINENSIGNANRDSHHTNNKKKQTLIDIFLSSAKEKLKQTKELELGKSDKKPPVRKIKKTTTAKESGKKRKKEMHSSGRIENYFTMKQNKDNENILNGAMRTNKDGDTSDRSVGGPEMVRNDIKKTRIDEGKAPLGVKLAAD